MKKIPLKLNMRHAEHMTLIPYPIKNWNKRLDRKKKMREFTEVYIDDWKKDPGERACRIWIFWKYKIIDDS